MPARVVDAGAILFTVLTASLEIRHYLYGGDIYHPSAALTEYALQACGALALAIGLERIRMRTNSIVHDIAARLLFGLALAVIVFGLMLDENPFLIGSRAPVVTSSTSCCSAMRCPLCSLRRWVWSRGRRARNGIAPSRPSRRSGSR